MIKYRAEYGWGQATVTVHEVERESATSVWINGSRSAKVTEYGRYYDTWEDAHAHIIRKAETDVESARMSLERAKGRLGQIKGMKKPEPQ